MLASIRTALPVQSPMLASTNASTSRARSFVRASTSAFSWGQLAKPYSRATATWASDSVTRPDTAPIRATAAGSPAFAARNRSLAW